MDLDAIRRELEQRRDETRRRVAGLAKRPERGEAQGFGKRIGDGTVEAISRLTEIGVGTTLESGLERTERALAKLGEGTYGRCDACGEPIAPKRLPPPAAPARLRGAPAGGEPIAPKRLAALPDAVLCGACAGARPGARPTPRR